MNRFIRGLVASVIMSLGGCSSGSGESTTATTGTGMSAKVASFDLVAERPQRFQVGLVDDANQSVLTGGAVGLSFRFMGRAEQSVKLPPSSSAEARFVPLAGQPDRPREQQPAFSSGATGVYRTDPVMFTDYGLWEVGVTAATTSGVKRATAFFKVEASSPLPRPGYRAPSTVNPLPGASGVSLTSIDSRADTTSNAVPDPELHSVTIAAALAAPGFRS